MVRRLAWTGRWTSAGTAVAIALLFLPAPASAQSALDRLRQARGAFEYGDFPTVIQLLEHQTDHHSDVEGLATEGDKVEAYKLLGLSHYYLGKPSIAEAQQAAREAFFELLKQNPDYHLDPLFVRPDAVALFDSVAKEGEQELALIRRYHRAKLEETAREEEARSLASLRRAPAPTPTVIERHLAINSPLVTALPFGMGQFQNGNAPLGIGMAVGQGAGALTSMISFLMISVLRDPKSGDFSGNSYTLANNFYISQWVGAGIFYALWASGVIEAAVHFVPQRFVSDAPSAAPDGPLKPPVPTTSASPPSGTTEKPEPPPAPVSTPSTAPSTAPPTTPSPVLPLEPPPRAPLSLPARPVPVPPLDGHPAVP